MVSLGMPLRLPYTKKNSLFLKSAFLIFLLWRNLNFLSLKFSHSPIPIKTHPDAAPSASRVPFVAFGKESPKTMIRILLLSV
jgi:hypothetical protein